MNRTGRRHVRWPCARVAALMARRPAEIRAGARADCSSSASALVSTIYRILGRPPDTAAAVAYNDAGWHQFLCT